MTSVWKRLQRVGKNASKFQFTASYQSLTVECSRKAKWQPNKLSVVWTRRRRRKFTKPQSWQPGISNPFRGVIVWPEPEDVDITVTLYKDPRPECHFEDKEWTFVVEDVAGGRHKPIAVGAINMADYASVEFQTFNVSLTLKISSKKIVSATLELQLSCILLKEGKATDADMQSIASMMSLNEIDCLEGFDEDEFERSMEPGSKLSHSNLFGGKGRADSGSDSSSITGSPAVKNKRKHKRSKSDAHKYLFTGDSGRRLSTGSDISVDKDSDKEATKHTSAAETKLLEWCRKCTEGYPGVKIKNMTTSWRNGLAFCALLHHFEPSLIDFKSLDPRNVQENNKMVFEEFDRLGIPRLLDPTTLALTSKPDKLSVMTYLFQIRTYFTTPKAPSLLNLRVGSMSYLPAIREVRAKAEQLSPTSKRPDGYNPFSGDDEEEDPPPPLKTSTPESKSNNSTTDKGGNPFEEEEDMPLSPRTDSKNVKDTSVSSIVIGKHSSDSGKTSAVSDNSVDNSVNVKKSYNPFEDDEEDMEIADASDAEKSSVRSPPEGFTNASNAGKSSGRNPPEGYNPFDDDDDEEEIETESKKTDISVSSKEKYGYNPFDDDENENTVDETAKSAKRKDSYDAYNPFDDDEEEELDAQPEASTNEVKQSLKETAYNPFDDESDDEQNVDSVGSVKPPPKPPRIGLYKVDETGKFRPRSVVSVKGLAVVDSGDEHVKIDDSKEKTADTTKSHTSVSETKITLAKIEEKQQETKSEGSGSEGSGSKTEIPPDSRNKDSRHADGETPDSAANDVEGKEGSPSTTEDLNTTGSEPAVQAVTKVSGPSEEDSPWVMRRSDCSTDSLKRRRPKPDGSSSPSRSRPSSMTRPPPLIPTFQEWKTAGPGADKESPKSTQKEDIKVVARRVLMEARKKAGASDLLPRERVEVTAAEKLDKPTGNTETVPGTTTNETADETKDGVNSNKAGKEGKSTENTFKEEQEKRKQEGTPKVIKGTKEKGERKRPSPKKRQAPAPPVRSPPPPPVVPPESSGKATVVSRPANRKLLEAKPRSGTRQVPQKKRQAPAPPSRTPPPPPAASQEPQPPRSKSAERATGSKTSSQAAKSTIQGNRKFEHRPLKVKLSKEKSPPLSPKDKSQNERNDLLSDKVTRENDDSEKIRRFKELLKESQGEKVEQEDSSIEVPPELPPKMNKNASVGERDATTSPSSSPRKKKLGHAAAAQAYAETRKMDFKNIRPVRHRRDTESGDLEDSTDSGTTVSLSSSPTKTNSTAPASEGVQGEEETSEPREGSDQEFQDTTEYVKQEILNLEEEQRALDKVASKLESELRNAMNNKGCEDEEERLLQEWFILVNKKNELVRRQTELSMLEKVDELERKHEMINRELRLLMAKEEWEKTEDDRLQEKRLIDELVGVVNMRDQLVQVEDSQIQQFEKNEKHVQSILDTRHLSKDDKSEQCCVQ